MRPNSRRLHQFLLGLLLLSFPPAARGQPDPVGKPPAPPPAADRPIQIVDALGQLLANADVALTLRTNAGDDNDAPRGRHSVVTRLKTDERGVVSLPGAQGAGGMIEVSHADWGKARAELSGQGSFSGSTLTLPLVKHDAPARGRALKGLVIGPDHRPVEGAAVRCADVRKPGEGLISSGTAAAAVTDADGHFCLYVPDASRPRAGGAPDAGDRAGGNRLPEHGDLIPANSRFDVTIDVPGGDDFFPWAGGLPNLDEAVVRLTRPPTARTFGYESPAGGFITDRPTLNNLGLWYTPPGNAPGGGRRFALPARYRAGGKLAAGTYLPDLDQTRFQPLEVKVDSPADLVFRLTAPVTYHGRVVDGPSGGPLAGAFVIGMNGTGQDNLARLDAAAWRPLHALPAAPAADSPALEPLRRMYTFDAIVRTDEQGRFELTCRRGANPFYGLIAFDQDRLPIMHRLYAARPDENGGVEIKDVPLFPAARALVRPVFKEPGTVSVTQRWAPAPQGQPRWFGAFRAAADGGERQFQYDGWLRPNEKQFVLVPAGMTLSLVFDTPYSDEWSAGDAGGDFRLDAGGTKDLGDLSFEKSLRITVRVVDGVGRPVEGAPVRRLDPGRNTWTVAHNSDGGGNARFYVRPRSAGQFGVIDLPGQPAGNPPANLICPYRAGEKADADAPYSIRMTPEQVQALAGPKPREL